MAKLPPAPTQDETDTICQFVRSGNYLRTAALYLGIKPEMVDAWLAIAKEEEDRRALKLKKKPPRKTYQPFLDFKDELTRAMQASEVESVVRIRAMARDEAIDPRLRFRAETFLLERRSPERWAKRLTDLEKVGGQKAASDHGGKDLNQLLADATKGVEEPDESPMDRGEAIDILTAIARGTIKTVKSTARGDLFLQPPSFKERHDAAVTLIGQLDKRASKDSGPRVGIVRQAPDGNETLH